jgi:hypothetical protein
VQTIGALADEMRSDSAPFLSTLKFGEEFFSAKVQKRKACERIKFLKLCPSASLQEKIFSLIL